MPAATELEVDTDEIHRQFDLVVAQEFDSDPKSVPLTRRWSDEVFTQIAANTGKRQVSNLVTDDVLDQITEANNDTVAALVAGVAVARRDDFLLAASELATNSVVHAKDQPPVELPLDDLSVEGLGALEAALTGNQDLNVLINQELGIAPPSEESRGESEPSTKFVAIIAVNTARQEVLFISGDSNRPVREGLSTTLPDQKAESGRGGKIVYEVSDGADILSGGRIAAQFSKITKVPVTNIAYGVFTPRPVPRPR